MTSRPLPERISTTDFFEDAALAAVEHNLSFFVFGGKEIQNVKAVEVMRSRFPGLRIVGRRNGYFALDDEAAICRQIQESGADVLWVALGKPLQEHWSVRNRENLAGVGWVKTCGGLLGHLAGDEVRAPRWVQSLGFEWLFRVLQRPRSLGWRYLTTNPQAVWLMIRNSEKRN